MSESFNEKSVCVVVLGDFGRSPRMQYHALSLARHNCCVQVIAYEGSKPLDQITNHKKIGINYMTPVPQFFSYFPKLIHYIFKTVWQAFFLLWMLKKVTQFDCMLIQNPPSIPTLPTCWFYCWMTNSCLLVDFHNYGYTLMSLTSRKDSVLVRIAKWCEKYFGKKANRSLCVTKAMKDDLQHNWNIRSSVFYDCAPDMFHPISIEEKHTFFMKLGLQIPEFYSKEGSTEIEERTRFTKRVGDCTELLQNRPALIVSSTSWTEDEDFSILLAALEKYEAEAKQNKSFPPLLVAITGKGPMKDFYEQLIKEKNFSCVEIITLWLKIEDYPTFLACADLGVSLHNSSSGLDLPMKVVDMFGCALPVCAVSFSCIDELVYDGVNGRIFSTHEELCSQFQELFCNFPYEATDLMSYQENLKSTSHLGWDENWDLSVRPLFQELFLEHDVFPNCANFAKFLFVLIFVFIFMKFLLFDFLNFV